MIATASVQRRKVNTMGLTWPTAIFPATALPPQHRVAMIKTRYALDDTKFRLSTVDATQFCTADSSSASADSTPEMAMALKCRGKSKVSPHKQGRFPQNNAVYIRGFELGAFF